ncbi:MAG: hypothetical protein AAF763_02460 [Pseudomonadota bacterium]
MTRLLEMDEGEPNAWPEIVDRMGALLGRDPNDPAVEMAAVWRRIEAWVSWRGPARSAAFTLEGPGEWRPPLHPFALLQAFRWDATSRIWMETTLPAAPLGYELDDGRWLVTGTAGNDDAPVPAEIYEAAQRLEEYMRGIANKNKDSFAYTELYQSRRAARYAARALELSGAADLLRPWRKLGARAGA